MEVKNELIPELKVISSNKSKFNSLTLLIVTIIAFFSTRIITAAWPEVIILIGVILFHELGHLLAMKALRYNDVKMFFIPFIGAAVSGKSKNDTAVKSCIVSLMGPFPGIILGVLLYILSLLTNNFYVFKTAQTMLLLNAFNFLPIMPLDGGRYIDVLFINRRYFRILFTLIGAGIFLLLAISAKDNLIGVISIVTIFIAISNYKLHGLSDELKAKGINAASVNDLIADEGSLQIVIEKLQTSYPKLFKPKIIYQAIFNKLTAIVDTIKFVPAKLLSTSILLVTYLILFSVSIIVSFTLLAANYKEIPRTEELDGKKYVCAERYVFGKKIAEHPIDDALYYDGKGTVFEMDGSIAGVNYYSKGYRTGEWLTIDNTGKTIEKKAYDRGQFISLSKLENGTWRTCSIEDLSFYERCIEEIKRLSQPYKSNYLYFERDKRG